VQTHLTTVLHLVQVLAAAVNAMMLAMLDAGLAMRTTVAAATVAYAGGSAEAWLDPTAAECEVRCTPLLPGRQDGPTRVVLSPRGRMLSLDPVSEQAAESVHTAAVATTAADDAVMVDSLGSFTAQQVRPTAINHANRGAAAAH
jgi:hypothetical protein